MSLDVYLENGEEVYWANITHNLTPMANACGLYKPLWRPEEIGIKTAKELIEPLTLCLKVLKNDPDEFKAYNPDNGWGSYEGLIKFTEGYLQACIDNPEAEVKTST